MKGGDNMKKLLFILTLLLTLALVLGVVAYAGDEPDPPARKAALQIAGDEPDPPCVVNPILLAGDEPDPPIAPPTPEV
jgi:hypothetical protein